MSDIYIKSSKIKDIIKLLKNNFTIIENYFFMTFVQVIGSLIGIIIYPFLIRKLGSESYGLYVFALSVTTYFFKIVSFGFSMPALKIISQNIDNLEIKNEVVSSVISAKCYLAILSIIIFFISLFFIPFLYQNKWIIIICFTQIISEIIYPNWYFQAVQKVRVVAILQLSIRLFSIPFIFLLIKKNTDISTYAIIASLSNILVALSSVIYLKIKENISIHFVSIKKLKKYFQDALPFFWSSSASAIKMESITIIIGIFFNMTDVAYYDLANKILLLPRLATSSINDALFPKFIKNTKQLVVKKIIQVEIIIGLSVIAVVVITGHWIVLLLGGIKMLSAYPLTIILSLTILLNLIISCYYYFIFVPKNKYYYITQNQLIAFSSFFIICISGVQIYHNIFIIVAALVLSGCCEVIYCNYLIKKHQLA